MPVYAFGDSHTNCAKHAEGVVAVYVGPITLHRLGRAGEPTKLFAQYWLGGDMSGIFVVAGEIDVRSHIDAQVMQGRSTEEVVEELADGATRCIAELRTGFATPVFFCSVIPPSLSHEDNPEFPFRGSFQDRVTWTNMLNQALEVKVDALYDPYVDFRRNGMLPPEFSDGSVHLHNQFGQQAFGPLVRRILR